MEMEKYVAGITEETWVQKRWSAWIIVVGPPGNLLSCTRDVRKMSQKV